MGGLFWRLCGKRKKIIEQIIKKKNVFIFENEYWEKDLVACPSVRIVVRSIGKRGGGICGADGIIDFNLLIYTFVYLFTPFC